MNSFFNITTRLKATTTFDVWPKRNKSGNVTSFNV